MTRVYLDTKIPEPRNVEGVVEDLDAGDVFTLEDSGDIGVRLSDGAITFPCNEEVADGPQIVAYSPDEFDCLNAEGIIHRPDLRLRLVIERA